MSEREDGSIPVIATSGRRLRRWAAVGGVAAVLLVVAGAALIELRHPGSTAPQSRSAPLDTAASDRLALNAPCDRVTGREEPAGLAQIATFDTVAVVECRFDNKAYPGEGEWSVLIRRVADAGLADLLTALQRPDDDPNPPQGGGCALVGYGPLRILLADGQRRYLHPRAPTTTCGVPQQQVQSVIDGLDWRTVSVTRIEQTRSQASIDAGCEMAWKNENAMGMGGHLGSGGPVFVQHPDADLKVCLYKRAGDPDVGEFDRSVVLSGTEGQQLREALAGPGPAGECAAQTGFAVIFAGGPYVNVELGGCWRVVRGDLDSSSTGSAQPDVVKRLLGLG